MTNLDRKTKLVWREHRKTCFAYSPGGHFAELNRALNGIRFDNAFHITFENGRNTADLEDGDTVVHRVTHPRRRVLATLRSMWDTARILLRERPKLIISTGADVAVPVLLIGRLLGAELVFIESGGTVGPTLSGRIVYPFAQTFIVQWPQQRQYYPKAILASGPLL
jgi:hypothetical protein